MSVKNINEANTTNTTQAANEAPQQTQGPTQTPPVGQGAITFINLDKVSLSDLRDKDMAKSGGAFAVNLNIAEGHAAVIDGKGNASQVSIDDLQARMNSGMWQGLAIGTAALFGAAAGAFVTKRWFSDSSDAGEVVGEATVIHSS